MRHFLKVLLLLGIFCIPIVNYAQATASGKAYIAPTWEMAKTILTPAGGVKGISITITGASKLGAFEKVVSSGTSIMNGAKFSIKDLPTNTKLKFRLYCNGKVMSGGKAAFYDFDFTIPKGSKYFDLGSFVYIVSESRWVPTSSIKKY